jgi:hypothetical protein
MWANHELLAYGLFLSQVTKSYKRIAKVQTARPTYVGKS